MEEVLITLHNKINVFLNYKDAAPYDGKKKKMFYRECKKMLPCLTR